eukprot:Pompholyxophrys_punicea_v1_NODE_1696_length_588_cov_4.579737.p1 type:complete len:137 gc:universal NODE_1696_length_588_cov_4.579737:62-472(+)
MSRNQKQKLHTNQHFVLIRMRILSLTMVVLWTHRLIFHASHHFKTHFQFDTNFFQQFGIVFNALDNLPARRHVNRMCLAADVPLIESGTAGYLGQVTVIKKAKVNILSHDEKIWTINFKKISISRGLRSSSHSFKD